MTDYYRLIVNRKRFANSADFQFSLDWLLCYFVFRSLFRELQYLFSIARLEIEHFNICFYYCIYICWNRNCISIVWLNLKNISFFNWSHSFFIFIVINSLFNFYCEENNVQIFLYIKIKPNKVKSKSIIPSLYFWYYSFYKFWY